jgi:hypothetical protein
MNAILKPAPIATRPIGRPRYRNEQIADQSRWIADNAQALRTYYEQLREWLDVDDGEDEFALFCRVQHDLAFLSDERRAEVAESRYTEARAGSERISDAIAGRVPL